MIIYVFQTYMYLNWFYFITTKPVTYLTWSRTRTLDVQDERSTNAPSEGELTASVLMIIIKLGESTDSVISLLNSR